VNVWRFPSEASGENEIFDTLLAGEGLVVVTNSPAESTVAVSEGLVFWRVLIPGTAIVGWAKEVIVDGSVRYLDEAEVHRVAAGDTCESIASGEDVDVETFMATNHLDEAGCADLEPNTLLVIPPE
jgi:hypothetical protein